MTGDEIWEDILKMTKEGKSKDEINQRFDDFMKKRYVENEVKLAQEKIDKRMKEHLKNNLFNGGGGNEE